MTMIINPFRFGGYTISQSIRFNDDDTAYMSRTPASAGNRKTWTFSCWIKRGNLGIWQTLLSARTDDNNRFQIRFNTSDQISITSVIAASTTINIVTNAVFRDPSAWYHILVNVDTAQATSSDRVSLWVNGTKATSFLTSTYPTLNEDTQINNTIQHAIGRLELAIPTQYYDGYFSEINLVDGTTYPSSSFGEADTNGNWIPKKFTGVYGTNGFYINGANAASLGTDVSGNSNNFTTSGLTTADQMLDSPTDKAVDGLGNRATLNILNNIFDAGPVLSDGNLFYTNSTAGNGEIPGTVVIPASTTDTWVIEFTNVSLGTDRPAFGLIGHNTIGDAGVTAGADEVAYNNGGLNANGVSQGTVTTDATVRMEYNGTANQIEVFTAGVSRLTFSWTPTNDLTFFVARAAGTATIRINTVIADMSGTVTASAKEFATHNLPAPATPVSVTPITTPSFTGNANADGPFIWLGYTPDEANTSTINGNTITWGTHARATAGGIKIITALTAYNSTGTNTISVAVDTAFGGDTVSQARAR